MSYCVSGHSWVQEKSRKTRFENRNATGLVVGFRANAGTGDTTEGLKDATDKEAVSTISNQ